MFSKKFFLSRVSLGISLLGIGLLVINIFTVQKAVAEEPVALIKKMILDKTPPPPFKGDPAAVFPSRYTQTRAYFSVDYLKDWITKWYGPQNLSSSEKKLPIYKKYRIMKNSLTKYAQIITDIISKEETFEDHYVFYQANFHALRVAEDLVAMLYELEKRQEVKDFIFLRSYKIGRYANLPAINSWMQDIIKKYGDDRLPKFDRFIRNFLLSANLSLFGNIGRPSSNTFRYFITNYSAKPPPMGLIFDETLTHFMFNPAQKAHLVAVLGFLADSIETKEGNLYQIFIPRHLVDQTVYFSKAVGIPWDTPIHEPTFDKKYGYHTKISPILNIYRNTPEKNGRIIDSFEARIIPRKELFANPKSGIKIFRYSTLDPSTEAIYKKRLKIIASFIYKTYMRYRYSALQIIKERIKQR